PVEGRLVAEEAEGIVGAEADAADAERTPTLAAKPIRQLTPFTIREADQAGVVALHDGDLSRELEQHLDALGPVFREQRHTYLHLLVLERAFALELDLRVDARPAHEHEPRGGG